MDHPSIQILRTKDVIGKNVISQIDKEDLGKVEELVLDKISGNVIYAVLSSGGFMGIGVDFYTIPWKTLSYCNEHQAFEVNITKDKIKGASGFNKDNWPNFADEIYNKSVNDFYNN